jgi:hypothetical protein
MLLLPLFTPTNTYLKEVVLYVFLWLEYLEPFQQFSHKSIHLKLNLDYTINEKLNCQIIMGFSNII